MAQNAPTGILGIVATDLAKGLDKDLDVEYRARDLIVLGCQTARSQTRFDVLATLHRLHVNSLRWIIQAASGVLPQRFLVRGPLMR